jgi:hypothetical protein
MQLHLLLHLEELQQELDVRMYDMQEATMLKSGAGFLALEVCCCCCLGGCPAWLLPTTPSASLGLLHMTNRECCAVLCCCAPLPRCLGWPSRGRQ